LRGREKNAMRRQEMSSMRNRENWVLKEKNQCKKKKIFSVDIGVEPGSAAARGQKGRKKRDVERIPLQIGKKGMLRVTSGKHP